MAQLIKNLPTMRDLGSIHGLGRSPGEGKGSPLYYSRLENSMDKESGTIERLSLIYQGLC